MIIRKLSMIFFALSVGVACAADLVIAQVGPFSGPLAANGRANYVGAKAYFDLVNSQGGVAGRMIKFIKEDDAYKPEQTVRLLRLVAERDKPIAFVNLYGSANTAAVVKDGTLQNIGIPVVGVTPGSEALREPGDPRLFHIQAGDRLQLQAILNHLSTIGLSRIGVAFQDNPFGKSGLDIIEKAAGIKGLTVVARASLPIAAEATSIAAAELRGRGAQAYIMVLAPNSGAAFVRDVKQLGDGTPIYGMSYVTAGLLVERAGVQKASGTALAQVTPNPATSATKLTREFKEAMKQYAPSGSELSSTTLLGYIAAQITVEAIRRTPNPTAASVEASLRKLRLNLGGYSVDFTDGRNVGSQTVDIGVVDRDGALRY